MANLYAVFRFGTMYAVCKNECCVSKYRVNICKINNCFFFEALAPQLQLFTAAVIVGGSGVPLVENNAASHSSLFGPRSRQKTIRFAFILGLKMSPKAIRSLINIMGVKEGVRVLNLFTTPDDWDVDGQFTQMDLSRVGTGRVIRIGQLHTSLIK